MDFHEKLFPYFLDEEELEKRDYTVTRYRDTLFRQNSYYSFNVIKRGSTHEKSSKLMI